jgi:hypothetical protein
MLLAAMVVAASIAVMRAERKTAAQLKALSEEQGHFVELRRLQDEHHQLSEEQISAVERQQLEFKHAEAEGLRARLAALKKRTSQDGIGTSPDNNDAPETVPAGAWIFAGRTTPRAAIESVLWAASHGDVEHLSSLLGFPEDVRAKAEALFSQLPAASQQEYGSPERVVAILLAGSFPKNASAMTILDDQSGEQDAVVSLRVDHAGGVPRTNKFNLHQTTDGWQLMVPASVMTGYEKTLVGPDSGAP